MVGHDYSITRTGFLVSSGWYDITALLYVKLEFSQLKSLFLHGISIEESTLETVLRSCPKSLRMLNLHEIHICSGQRKAIFYLIVENFELSRATFELLCKQSDGLMFFPTHDMRPHTFIYRDELEIYTEIVKDLSGTEYRNLSQEKQRLHDIDWEIYNNYEWVVTAHEELIDDRIFLSKAEDLNVSRWIGMIAKHYE